MSVKSLLKGDLTKKLTPFLIVAVVFLAYSVGVLYKKVIKLEKATSSDNKVAGQQKDVVPTTPPPTSGKLNEDRAKKIPQVSDSDHLKGSREAKVFLIEYSDFDCLFCSRFHPTATQIVNEYKGEVAWVYRHFPLDTIHPNARPKAEISECVAAMGGNDKFWELVDKVFEPTAPIGSGTIEDFLNYVSDIGLNKDEVRKCYENKVHKSKVNDVYQGGLNAGVTGTPGNFVINNKGKAWLIPGAVPYETLKMTIDEALRE